MMADLIGVGGRVLRAGFVEQIPCIEGDITWCVCLVWPQRSVGVVLALVNDMATQSHMGNSLDTS